MRPRGMWLFYVAWVAVCALSFATSTLLGFVTVAFGMALRMLEEAVRLLRDLVSEQRLTRLELRARRAMPQVNARD